MSFELARKIADAVLYEGYMLYPYRASSAKNRYRWQFGVVAPRAWAETGGDPCEMQTECLIDPDITLYPYVPPSVEITVRFLQVRADSAEDWDEAIERIVELHAIPLDEHRRHISISAPDSKIAGRVEVGSELIDGFIKLRVRIENLTELQDAATADRKLAMRLSLAGVHTMLSITRGSFVSLTDPPPEAAAAAAQCRNLHTWPVLVGPAGARDVMLSSPIILPDYPVVAPESQGDFFDATEIDEMLTLRVMTLTDDEKREALATDDRARQIIERCDTIPPEVFERLHGAIRTLAPVDTEQFFNPTGYQPELESVDVGSSRVSRGQRVRLNPKRNADVMDMFLAGRIARVESVQRDVDDRVYVAVTVEDDPAAELHRSFGRFFYFYPEELEALGKEN